MTEIIKWLFFPGTNLHARLRWTILAQFFDTALSGSARTVLDAGCGNGMLAYQAYRKGNKVLGVSIKSKEVEGCRRLFNEFLSIPGEELSFRVFDLTNLDGLGAMFDEIICSEVLEHIADDESLIASFSRSLKPNGVLHLCVPNADHPHNRRTVLDTEGRGGHVREGYTYETARTLLEKMGFVVERYLGLGGPVRQFFNSIVIRSEALWKPLGVPLFLLALAFVWIDPRQPKCPYSIYLKARKRNTLTCLKDPLTQ